MSNNIRMSSSPTPSPKGASKHCSQGCDTILTLLREMKLEIDQQNRSSRMYLGVGLDKLVEKIDIASDLAITLDDAWREQHKAAFMAQAETTLVVGLKEEIERLEQKNEQQERRVNQLEKEREEAYGTVANLLDERRQIKEEAMQQVNKTINSIITESTVGIQLGAKVREMKANYDKLQSEYETLQSDHARLKSDHEKLDMLYTEQLMVEVERNEKN